MFRILPVVALLICARPVAASATEPASASEASEAPQKWLYEHSLGVGYRFLFLKTKSGDGYTLNGPSLAYGLFIGRAWGLMLHAEAHLPQFGDMHGPSGNFSGGLGDFYNQQRLGVDLSALLARRLPLGNR